MRLPVNLQREIARLYFYDQSRSNRAIASAIGVSANTVKTLRRALERYSGDPSQLLELDDTAWRAALGTANRSIAQRKSAPDWEWVHSEMGADDDATLEAIWREWRAKYPDGIGYSQFTDGYRTWTKRRHMAMRKAHVPGDKLFVDFAGRTVEVKNPAGGHSIEAQIFVAVLGYSNFSFLWAVPSQKTADWIACHDACFAALGGVPTWVVPDNLKSAVWRREKYRLVINTAYRECLSHYNTAALPTGVRKPKHKAKAEVGVQISQRWVLFALRRREFFSMDELNAELIRLTALLNARPFKKMSGSRMERFQKTEQAKLKPLPGKSFELCDWRYGVRVGDDYHVAHERSFYSVPSEFRSERVDLKFTASTLEIMLQGRRIALHPLAQTEGEIITLPAHRPVTHIHVLEAEPKALLQWAESVGVHASTMIRHHLEDRSDQTNGLRAARRMRDMARLHGDARFEEVCAYALPLNITSLRSVESILKQAPDKRSDTASRASPRPAHGNVRGAEYFGEGQ